MARRDEIVGLLRDIGLPLADDDIGGRLGINRHYVNQVCRQLAREGFVARSEGPDGKLRNRWRSGATTEVVQAELTASSERVVARPRIRRVERARSNVESLVGVFAECVSRFERSNAFPGPSLYFHERAIARRRSHASVDALMADDQFFEYVYAVLPAWGMHRMGKQAAKVGEFGDMVTSFRAGASVIAELWDLDIRALSEREAEVVAKRVWLALSSLKVSTSATRIVAGSKALHHVLPDLVPPIDRQYTFQFFTGQRAVNTGDERAFLEWFPYLAEIGRRVRTEIDEALERGGFMATGAAKVIDNAIIGFMQGEGGGWMPGED
jgi:hypothetical protein